MMITPDAYSLLIYGSLILRPAILIASVMWRWLRYGTYRTHVDEHFWQNHETQSPRFAYPPGPHVGKGSKYYRRSDERIVEEIHDRLLMHGGIDPEHIEVTSVHGVVTLTGIVDHRRSRRRVEEVVDTVAGVMEVHNQIELQTQRHTSPILAPGLKNTGLKSKTTDFHHPRKFS